MEYLDDLNPEQRQAVEYVKGPLLILAGAGSGKTRVLTYKIVHLVSSGLAKPHEIMAVTFTNKAAQEMKSRIKDMLPGVRFPFIGTFHSFCANFLRAHGGAGANFVIYDEGDRRVVLRECVRELNIDEKRFSPEKAGAIISRLKNKLQSPADHGRQSTDYDSRVISDIYALYEEKMTIYNAMDFDDLLVKTVNLLRDNEELAVKTGRGFRYILVDEYQDVNYVQYVLMRLLASHNRNITVVGDDDQSIYGFRGAEMEILERFEDDFKDAHLVKLERNYRSTQIILDAANELMRNNTSRKEKNLWTDIRGEGHKITYFRASDGRGEARFVASQIREFARSGRYDYKDLAVIYRTNAQSRPFEEAFIQEGIPYNLIGSLKFYERKEIKDLLAYLKVIINPDDSVSLRRIINVPPRGLGDVTLNKIESLARTEKKSLFEGARSYALSGEGSSKARKSLSEFIEVIDDARRSMSTATATEVLKTLVEKTQYRAHLIEAGRAEDIAREENIDELFNVIREFEEFSENNTPEAFLHHVALISDIDLWDEREGRVNLMTFHLTKGLEFPVVFMTGLEEKYLPHAMANEKPSDIEEERRLCYVGITRARERLFFSHAEIRFSRGVSEPRLISRFLKEIPEHLLSTPLGQGRESQRPGPGIRFKTVVEEVKKEYEPLIPGDRVMHKEFGSGAVITAGKSTVTVDFDDRGVKTLVRDFVKKEKSSIVFTKKKSCFEKGDRVVHRMWGTGIVCLEDAGKDCLLVIFPKIGSRNVKSSELQKISQNTETREKTAL